MTAHFKKLIGSNQGIGLAALLLLGGTVGSRALGLVRDIVVTNVFGLGPELDAYYAAFRIPDLIFQLVTGAAIASAFIPVFTGLLAKNRDQDAWRLANASLTVAFAFTLVLSIAAMIATPLLVPLLGPGFTAEQISTAEPLIRIMLLSPIIFSASALAMAILNGRKHFLLTAIAPWGYNLSIILGALLLAPIMGIMGLAVGVVAGAAAHLLIQIPGLRLAGMQFRPRFDLRLPALGEVGRLMVPRVFSLGAVQLSWLVVTAIASTLPSGQLSALNVAWPIMMLPLGLFGWSVASALFPTLAEQKETGHDAAFNRTAERGLRTILFLTVPSAIGLAVLAPYLVSAVYERSSFTAQNAEMVAAALLFFAIGLPAHAALELITRIFYSARDTRTPLMMAILFVVINIALGLYLAQTMGHSGLALAMSVATIVETGLLWMLSYRRLGFKVSAAGMAGMRTMAAAGVAMLAALIAFRLLAPPASEPVAIWGQSLAGVTIGGLCYLAVARLFGSPELGWIVDRLRLRR